jgi:trans-aconitate 2-methyltransferase
MKQLLFGILLFTGMQLLTIASETPSQQWRGAFYDSNSEPQYQIARTALTRLTVNNYRNILDIGCGSGKVTDTIANLSPRARIEAIDFSENMIKAAHAKYPNPAITFKVADARRLPYHSEFDLAVCFSCLHWIQDKAAVLQGIARALKPIGAVLITGSTMKPTDPLLRSFLDLKTIKPWDKLLASVDYESQFFPLSQAQVSNLMQQAGILPIEVSEKFLPFRFPDKQAFTQWLLGWTAGLPILAQLTKQQQEALLATVVERYAHHVQPNKDGSIEYMWPYIAAIGQKLAPISHKIEREHL